MLGAGGVVDGVVLVPVDELHGAPTARPSPMRESSRRRAAAMESGVGQAAPAAQPRPWRSCCDAVDAISSKARAALVARCNCVPCEPLPIVVTLLPCCCVHRPEGTRSHSLISHHEADPSTPEASGDGIAIISLTATATAPADSRQRQRQPPLACRQRSRGQPSNRGLPLRNRPASTHRYTAATIPTPAPPQPPSTPIPSPATCYTTRIWIKCRRTSPATT